VALLDTFTSEPPPLALIFPRNGPLDTHAYRMERGVEQPLAPPLGGVTIPRIRFDVGDHPRVEDPLPMACGINATVEVDLGASPVSRPLFRHLLQGFQALR